MKKIILCGFYLLHFISGLTQTAVTETTEIEKNTYTFLVRNDTTVLKMDTYRLKSDAEKEQPCMFFIFGGGFMTGKRDDPFYTPYFNKLVEKGITVVSIDYRLGMKNNKPTSVFNTKPIEDAIQMGVEDLFEATGYVLKHAQELKIDTSKIMISGSSAGAIIALQADYIKRNDFPASEILPPHFQYSGVLSFAGAIFSRRGTPDYEIPPAPTLFFHGEKDKLVSYNEIRFFNIGLFGSERLAKRFKKRNYPYCFYSVEEMAHTISTLPLKNYLNQIIEFIEEFIYNQKQWQMDIKFHDKALIPDKVTKVTDMYE